MVPRPLGLGEKPSGGGRPSRAARSAGPSRGSGGRGRRFGHAGPSDSAFAAVGTAVVPEPHARPVDRPHRGPGPVLDGQLVVVRERRPLDLEEELRDLDRLGGELVDLVGREEPRVRPVEEGRPGSPHLVRKGPAGRVDRLARVGVGHGGDELRELVADGGHLDAGPGPEVGTQAGDGPLARREQDAVAEEVVHAVVVGVADALEALVPGDVARNGRVRVVGHGVLGRLPATPGASGPGKAFRIRPSIDDSSWAGRRGPSPGRPTTCPAARRRAPNPFTPGRTQPRPCVPSPRSCSSPR